jgi:hypothetical protein
LTRRGVSPKGNIHVTAGVKPTEILTLLQRIQNWPKSNQTDTLTVDPQQRGVIGSAAGAAAQLDRAQAQPLQAYQGLVALMGQYIAGQRMILQGNDEDDLEQHEKDELQGHLTDAKLMVPILSRTDLGVLQKQMTSMPKLNDFIDDVLTAAGLDEMDYTKPLFPVGLNAQGVMAANAIEVDDKITIFQWIQGIYHGADKRWSESKTKSGQDFGLEEVGPKYKELFLCCIPVLRRAQGIILEIRAFDSKNLVPLRDWGRFADQIAAVFRALNA